MKIRSAPVIAWGLLAATAVLALMAGCTRPAPPPAQAVPAPLPVVKAAADFAGSTACAECHQGIFDRQSRSRHALTLHLMSRAALGKSTPSPGKIPGTGMVLLEHNDIFAFGMPAQSDQVSLVEYAIGSGKTGITFASVLDSDRMVEFRQSYFPNHKSWYTTPGQERMASDDVGKIHHAADARKCILCHAVALPAGSLEPQERFFGVGCESCHGPGSAPVAAMRAGRMQQIGMESMQKWPATRLNDMCGGCHGTEEHAKQMHFGLDRTNRMQAFGLSQSQCFKQSKDTLSCISCHDPHTDAATEEKPYVAVCLQCHAASHPGKPAPPLQTAAAKPCPVNPQDKCIGCHMPKRPAIADSKLPTLMADHFIRIHR